MSKRIFISLVILMSISLIGIIFIQSFLIFKNYQENDKQFSSNINYVLDETASMVERKEFRKYVVKFKELINSELIADTTNINNLIIIDENPEKKETIIYRNGVIEENLIFPVSKNLNALTNLINKDENIYLKRLSNQREEKIFINQEMNDDIGSEKFLLKIGKISKSKEILFESAYNDLANRIPVEDRIGDPKDFESILKRNLDKMGIELAFEFAIYNKDSITGIHSKEFESYNTNYSSPIFKDDNGLTNYSLKVVFPGRTPFLLSSLIPVIITSFIFTLIIVIAYITTILLLIKQKKISQIKTDFINNMTHEFKTPIATINLALSAIKNPKTISDKFKIKKYLKMIYDENNRMNDQVENILMISHLERNKTNIKKNKQDLHEIIDVAISHVNLIIENKKGIIVNKKNAKNSNVIGNKTHLINVFVNILDNAIKYNENNPKIIVETNNLNNKIVINIRDNGIGISKPVQSKIFEKFFRKQTGDLHNVKGHGLGLAYVKKIIDFHDGDISLKSIIDKGTTFTIKLNVLND